jgi:hypothetical protein
MNLEGNWFLERLREIKVSEDLQLLSAEEASAFREVVLRKHLEMTLSEVATSFRVVSPQKESDQLSDQLKDLASSRLEHLKNLIDRYQAQIQGMEEAALLAMPMNKPLIQQNIQFLQKEMRVYEKEYYELIAQLAKEFPLSEPEVIVAEVVEQLELSKVQPSDDPLELIEGGKDD